MRRTINLEHRECSLHVAIVLTIAAARGFGKPGDLDPTGSPVAHTGAAQPRGEGVARRGSATQPSACLPRADVRSPLGRAHFFLGQTSRSLPLRSSLCPPGPVSRTSAMSGADGRGACERITCSHGSPPPPSLPPHLCRPQPPVAQTAGHVPPFARGAAGTV